VSNPTTYTIGKVLFPIYFGGQGGGQGNLNAGGARIGASLCGLPQPWEPIGWPDS
jgi:hypothetical protein